MDDDDDDFAAFADSLSYPNPSIATKPVATDTPTITNTKTSPPTQQRQQQQPTAQQIMAAMGTNPRRILLGTASATGIALAGNFLGVTSKLLTLVPESAVEATGVDTYFPRGTDAKCQ